MKRVINIDSEYKCNAGKAIEKFFKKYPEYAEEWKETFESMAENGIENLCDNIMADGTENRNWCYSLWLDNSYEGYTYIALITRE